MNWLCTTNNLNLGPLRRFVSPSDGEDEVEQEIAENAEQDNRDLRRVCRSVFLCDLCELLLGGLEI
jgi:hypothetical protein